MTRVTVRFLSGDGKGNKGFLDRQCPQHHSWWVTPEGAFVVKPKDGDLIYRLLLAPPRSFALLLIDNSPVNLIQLAVANDKVEIKGDTPLEFTINGVVHSYTVYEMEHALKHGPEGKPGIMALMKIFGKPSADLIAKDEQPKAKLGRPQIREGPKKQIQMSGNLTTVSL